MSSELDRIAGDRTYMIVHNPNCPSRYMALLCGENGMVEYPPRDGKAAARMVRAYGQSAEEALLKAIEIDEGRRAARAVARMKYARR